MYARSPAAVVVVGPRGSSGRPFLQGLAEVATEAVMCLDATGHITEANDRVLQMFRYRADQLAGRHVTLLFPQGMGHDMVEGAPESVAPPAFPLARQPSVLAHRSDGSVLHVELRLGVIQSDCDPTYAATMRDVTDQIAQQEAAHVSQTRLRDLIEGAEIGFVLRTRERFLYVSRGYTKIWGYDPLSERPDDTLKRIHPEDRERLISGYWRDCSLGLRARAEFRIIRADGQVRWIRATAAPIVGLDGTVNRYASTAEDITDRKVAESALRSAHAEADKANAAKNEFLSRTSHELRTPLNAVLGFAQLLELDDLTADQDDAVRHILRGGRHLLGLIDDVLDIAKIEGNRLDVSLEPVAVDSLLADAIQLMTPMAVKHHITMHHEPVGDDPTGVIFVRADRRRLNQVIVNLLSNAIKYNIHSGDVYVAHDVFDQMVNITVRDTGRGITPANVARLFTPFDRLDASATGIEGTGIGLALSLRLMAVMGGDLTAESVHGIGSTFTATLPRTQSASSPDIDPETAPDTHDNGVNTYPRRSLLYIEDNTSNAELMDRLLKRRPQWHMDIATHGAVGLELALTSAPDLILLDLHLPDMNGLDVLTELRAHPRHAATPIIVVSADANPHQINRLLASGASQYLTKPLPVHTLLQILDGYAEPT